MYETKVILRSLANQIALATTTKQAFEMVRSCAEAEGVTIPDYDKVRAQLLGEEKQTKE
jgi:hypothetical protein